MNIFRNILSEFRSILPSERLFILFAMIAGFCISGEYAIMRPSSTSIFLSVFSSSYLPIVWLVTVPLNLLVVQGYNRFLPRIGALPMFAFFTGSVICCHLLAVFLVPYFPSLIFFHFVWKDIYILLMFKQLWSLIHMTIPKQRAKYLYGLIYGMGTLGSIVCSIIPGLFATKLGSTKLFFLSPILYLGLFWAYRKAFKRSSLAGQNLQDHLPSDSVSLKSSFACLKSSRFLLSILLLVVFMQMSVGLMEYQFNHHLELHITDLDLRTAYCGKIMAVVNVLSAFLQLIGSFLLVHFLGLKKSNFFIPFMLLANMCLTVCVPGFFMMAFAFTFLKAVDFSLFGVLREMLYIPLKVEEKFRIKAIIDVFAYRSSKALASFLILGLQFAVGGYVLPVLKGVCLVIFVAWLFLAMRLFQYEKEVVPS